jgi:hypothetical protein
MEHKGGLLIVLWIVVLFGAFFLARGMTGKAITDLSISDQCVFDKDCSSGKICCNAMCSTPEVCNEITNFSLNEIPQKESNYMFDIGLGFFILIAVLVAFFAVHRKSEVKVKKISKGKRRKKKK